MKVTSETLFHFTKSRLNLEKILSERFKITYCQEDFSFMGENSGSLYFPMISFCDLPLASAKNHISKYGNYAIGMTKEWGIKNNLNPVLYLESKSNITKDIDEQWDTIKRIINSISSLMKLEVPNDERLYIKSIFDNTSRLFDSNNNLFRYIKCYQGELTRGTKIYKNYRFYDEREWRYIPKMDCKDVKWYFNEEDYKEYRGITKTKKLLDKPILDFMAEDIKYLIVKSGKDISPLIRKINSIKHLCLTRDQADILITKILTIESLNSDF